MRIKKNKQSKITRGRNKKPSKPNSLKIYINIDSNMN